MSRLLVFVIMPTFDRAVPESRAQRAVDAVESMHRGGHV